MKLSSIHDVIRTLLVPFVAGLVLAPVLCAQMSPTGQSAPPSTLNQTNAMQQQLHLLTDVQRQSGTGIEPQEEAAYKNFYSVKTEDVDKRIQLGKDFLQKYPKSLLAEAVDAGLVTAYYDKQDWKDFYATADNALALKPDDVDVLTTVGWVIPHFFNPQDADADQRLDKAETFEKHAIQVLGTMPKPAYLTDAQFAAVKVQKSIQAHSALGLVYFRRNDFDNSAKELEASTQNNPAPDQTDLFVLGMDLENMNRDAEAADAFGRCAQILGGLQDRCKQSAAELKK